MIKLIGDNEELSPRSRTKEHVSHVGHLLQLAPLRELTLSRQANLYHYLSNNFSAAAQNTINVMEVGWTMDSNMQRTIL